MHGFSSGEETKAAVVLAPNMWLMASKGRLTCMNWAHGPGCVLALLHLDAKENSQPGILSQSPRECFNVFQQSPKGAREPGWGPAPRI